MSSSSVGGSLHRAARVGDLSVLTDRLPRAEVNSLGRTGCAPLHMACANDQHAFARRLLQLGAEPDLPAPGLEGCTALHVAALNGYTSCVRVLLDSGGADPSATSANGSTALHYAAKFGHAGCLGVMLQAVGKGSPRIDARDRNGCTALHLACADGRWQCAHLLLAQGSSAIVREANGWTPIHVASCWNGGGGREAAEAVGAMLATPGAIEAAIMDSVDTVAVAEPGSDGNGSSQAVETALEVVVREGGCPEIATLLVQMGAALGEMATPAAQSRLEAMVGASAALAAQSGIIMATGLAGKMHAPGSSARLDWAVGFAGHGAALRSAREFVSLCRTQRDRARGLAGVAIVQGAGATGPAGVNLSRRVATGLGADIVEIDASSRADIDRASSRVSSLRSGDAAAIVCAAVEAGARPGRDSHLINAAMSHSHPQAPSTVEALEDVFRAGRAKGVAVYVLVAENGAAKGEQIPARISDGTSGTVVATLRFSDPTDRDRNELAFAELSALRAAVYKRSTGSGATQIPAQSPLLVAFSPSVPAMISSTSDIVEGVTRVRRALERALGDGRGRGGRVAFVRDVASDGDIQFSVEIRPRGPGAGDAGTSLTTPLRRSGNAVSSVVPDLASSASLGAKRTSLTETFEETVTMRDVVEIGDTDSAREIRNLTADSGNGRLEARVAHVEQRLATVSNDQADQSAAVAAHIASAASGMESRIEQNLRGVIEETVAERQKECARAQDLDTLRTSHESLSRDVESLSSRCVKATADADAALTAAETAGRRIDAIKPPVDHTAEIRALSDRVDSLPPPTDVSHLKTAIAAVGDSVQSVLDDLAATKRDIPSVDTIDSLRVRCDAHEATLEAVVDRISRAEQTLESSSATDRETLMSEIAQVKESVSAVGEKNASVGQGIKELAKKHAETVARLDAHEVGTLEEIQALGTRVGQVESDSAALRDAVDRQSSDISALTAEVSQIKENAEQAKKNGAEENAPQKANIADAPDAEVEILAQRISKRLADEKRNEKEGENKEENKETIDEATVSSLVTKQLKTELASFATAQEKKEKEAIAETRREIDAVRGAVESAVSRLDRAEKENEEGKLAKRVADRIASDGLIKTNDETDKNKGKGKEKKEPEIDMAAVSRLIDDRIRQEAKEKGAKAGSEKNSDDKKAVKECMESLESLRTLVSDQRSKIESSLDKKAFQKEKSEIERGFDERLGKLSKSIPDKSDVEKTVDTLVDKRFEALQKDFAGFKREVEAEAQRENKELRGKIDRLEKALEELLRAEKKRGDAGPSNSPSAKPSAAKAEKEQKEKEVQKAKAEKEQMDKEQKAKAEKERKEKELQKEKEAKEKEKERVQKEESPEPSRPGAGKKSRKGRKSAGTTPVSTPEKNKDQNGKKASAVSVAEAAKKANADKMREKSSGATVAIAGAVMALMAAVSYLMMAGGDETMTGNI